MVGKTRGLQKFLIIRAASVKVVLDRKIHIFLHLFGVPVNGNTALRGKRQHGIVRLDVLIDRFLQLGKILLACLFTLPNALSVFVLQLFAVRQHKETKLFVKHLVFSDRADNGKILLVRGELPRCTSRKGECHKYKHKQ